MGLHLLELFLFEIFNDIRCQSLYNRIDQHCIVSVIHTVIVSKKLQAGFDPLRGACLWAIGPTTRKQWEALCLLCNDHRIKEE